MRYALAFTTLALLAFAGCAADDTEPDIVIGGLYTLSGDYTFLRGSAMGVRMAVDDFQADTGLSVRLIEEDDRSCADKSVPANKLVHLDGVQAIVGTTCSSVTLTVAPITDPEKVILISGTSTSADVTDAGDYVFRTIGSDGLKSKRVAEEIDAQGYNTVAVIYGTGNDATTTTLDGLKAAVPDSVNLVVEPVMDEESDFRTTLLKIYQQNPDAMVLIFTAPNQYALIATQRDQLDLERIPTYSIIETIENPEVIEAGGNHVEGIMYPYFAEPKGQRFDDFADRFEERFGERPPAYAAENYDATMITLTALAQSDGTPEDAQRQMFAVGTNYPGVSGEITFDENGDIPTTLIMKTIKNGEFVEVNP